MYLIDVTLVKIKLFVCKSQGSLLELCRNVIGCPGNREYVTFVTFTRCQAFDFLRWLSHKRWIQDFLPARNNNLFSKRT